jgi:ketosteroid isomerase-like protein
LFDHEIEWDTTGLLPDGRVHRGRAEIRAYWEDVAERWEDLRIADDRWLEGEDCVVMLGRLISRGARSGAPVEAPWHQVWRFRGDVPIRCDNYSDAEAALRAAGLSSERSA